eukprot:SAG11_NODE_613_length_8205_cov_28.925487_9_plen_88_part_00
MRSCEPRGCVSVAPGLALGGVSTVVRLAQANTVKVTIRDNVNTQPGRTANPTSDTLAVQVTPSPPMLHHLPALAPTRPPRFRSGNPR